MVTTPRAVVELPTIISLVLNVYALFGVNAKNCFSKSFSRMYDIATPCVLSWWVPAPWLCKSIGWLELAFDDVVASLIVLSSTLIA